MSEQVRARRNKPGKVKAALIGFVRTIVAPTQHPPELKNLLEKVDCCLERCSCKIQQLAPKKGE